MTNFKLHVGAKNVGNFWLLGGTICGRGDSTQRSYAWSAREGTMHKGGLSMGEGGRGDCLLELIEGFMAAMLEG